jgi:hypothetical protein
MIPIASAAGSEDQQVATTGHDKVGHRRDSCRDDMIVMGPPATKRGTASGVTRSTAST